MMEYAIEEKTGTGSRGPVLDYLEQGEKLLNELAEEIDSLRTQMAPVLRPADVPPNEAALLAEVDVQSPLADGIGNLCEKIRSRLSEIRALRERLDLP